MDKYKFGEYIYNKRKKLGLTQEELGRMLGVTNKAVSKWEVGETMPDVMMLKPLAKALGITVDELLQQEDKPQEEIKEDTLAYPVANKKLLYSLIILSGILLVGLIVFISLYFSSTKTNDEVETLIDVTNENIQEVVNVNPSSQIICNEETLEIHSTYGINESFDFNKDTNLEFTVVYQFIYYYYLKDGSVGVVTYYNRFYDIVLNNETKETSISILLEPKFNLDDFKGFKKVEISYIVLNAQGSVVKNEN